jgi:hypothetical protein
MSVKNRAFALAVGTAALIGLSAPVASAASFAGPGSHTSGFNNDSILNVAGNQIPLQACNDYVPVNVLGGQADLASIAAALGLLSSGNQTSSTDTSCTQDPSQSITSTTTTVPAASTTSTTTGGSSTGGSSTGGSSTGGSSTGGSSTGGSSNAPSMTPASAGGSYTPGFNNDSIVNLSNNQVPLQACNDRVPVNVLGIQVPASDIAGALGILTSGNTSATTNSSCHQTSDQDNSSSTNS